MTAKEALILNLICMAVAIYLVIDFAKKLAEMIY